MSIVKIEEIQLHTSDVHGSPAENIQADAFFERTGIPYTRIYYNNLSPSDQNLEIINSYYSKIDSNFISITTIPFLQYTEVHDDIPARLSPVKFIQGIAAIKAFPEVYNSIMNK